MNIIFVLIIVCVQSSAMYVIIIIIIMQRIFVVTDSLSALILNVNYWFCTNSLSAALSCDNLNFSMTIFIPSKFLTMHE